jgi:hypothetical protein
VHVSRDFLAESATVEITFTMPDGRRYTVRHAFDERMAELEPLPPPLPDFWLMQQRREIVERRAQTIEWVSRTLARSMLECLERRDRDDAR